MSSQRGRVFDILTVLQHIDDKLGGHIADLMVKRNPSGHRHPKVAGERRHQRFWFDAMVMMAAPQHHVKGFVLNISKSGVLVEAGERCFRGGEIVRMVIKPSGLRKYYRVLAKVVRVSSVGAESYGYALKFVGPRTKSPHSQARVAQPTK